jgi:hypothetical protein
MAIIGLMFGNDDEELLCARRLATVDGLLWC